MNLSKAQSEEITWRENGTPVSERFDDPYFSLTDGFAETEHVFLTGNNLPERFHDDFHIAELGFGTGLNFLSAWRLWVESDQTSLLKFTSFEMFPLKASSMEQALSIWPALTPYMDEFLSAWSRGASMRNDKVELNVIIGDARDTLPIWQEKADAWFLDGFSPSKNPELWSPEIYREIANHSNKNATFATYSAAGHVRRGLGEVGFDIEKRQGYGHKRHMCVGRYNKNG